MKSMKKLLVFVFLFVFSIILTACGGSKDGTKKPDPAPSPTPSGKTLSFISAKYKDNTYNFDGNVVIEYDEDFVFNQSDFIVTANYSDSSTEEVTPSSFGIYDSSDILCTSNYLPGSYSIKIAYSTTNTTLVFTVDAININDATFTGINSSYDYTGESIKPEVVVTYENKTLVLDTDYLVGYDLNRVDSGSILISGIGKYQNTKTINFTINNLNPTIPTFTNKAYDYDGTDKYNTVCPNLESLSTVGIASIYYTVTKDNQVVSEIKNNGTYNVTVNYTTLEGYNEASPSTFIVTIGGVSISNATVSEIEFAYTGYAPTETDLWGLTVTVNNIDLEYQVDYTVSLNSGEGIDNINASTSTTHASIILTGIGNYGGTKIVDFNISPRSIHFASIDLDFDSYYEDSNRYTYNGSEKTLIINSILYNTFNLVLNTDYTISYTNNVEAGTANLAITGIGNYNETENYQFSIYKKGIEFDSPTYTNNGIKQYDGTAFECVITNLPNGLVASYEYYYMVYPEGGGEGTKVPVTDVTEPRDYYFCDYSLSLSTENDEFGNRYDNNFVFTGNPYGVFSITVTCIPATVEFNDTRATLINDYYHYDYTGSAITPIVIVKDDENNTVNSSEYTVRVLKLIQVEIEPGVYTDKIVECDAIDSGTYFFEIASNHYRVGSYTYFYIDKIDLTTEQKEAIVWPKAVYNIYTANTHLDNSGNVPFITDSNDFEFALMNNPRRIVLTMTNYKDETLSSDDIVYEYNNIMFEYFKLNGTSLTAEEIYNHIIKYDYDTSTYGDITYGDKIEIKMNEGYYVDYQIDNNNFTNKSTTATFYAGVGADNFYLYEFTIRVYEGETYLYESRTTSIYTSVITSFTIDYTNVLIQNNFDAFVSVDGGTIYLSLKEGYVAQYSSTNGGEPTEKMQILSMNYLGSDGTGYIDIFRNGSTDYFLRVIVTLNNN